METIQVRYIGCEPYLEQADYGDWIDLQTREEVKIIAGAGLKLIPLGVAIRLPKQYEAIIAMRSSSYKKWGIIQTNAIGVIDESYCGDNDEWLLPVIGTRDIVIPKGTRLAQFRIIEHQPIIEFKAVDHLAGKNRGGFGSTGD